MKPVCKLNNIINDILGTDYSVEKIRSEKFEDIGFDSLLFVTLLIRIEEEFSIEIKDEDTVSPVLTNFDTLLDFVEKKIND